MRYLPAALCALSLGALCACAPSAPSSSDSYSSTPVDMSHSSKASQSAASAWDGTLLTGKHTVVLKTSQGDITLELDADASPKTVTNFVTLAKQGFYNNLTFHRVIPGFMIQGGDPNGNGTGGASIYGSSFPDEITNAPQLYKVGYKKGVVAMANSGPNTNGSQFFIMESDYPLPPNYTIFGKVTKGQDVVSAIAKVPRDSDDMPTTPVTFTAAVTK
jgi:cyclophilin family peptidyl-prolyl cis-trans isomerase